SNQTEKSFDMHFDTDPSSSYVISKSHKSLENDNPTHSTSLSSQDKIPHKYNIGKHLSFKVILPQKEDVSFPITLSDIAYNVAIPENYDYLFFREINPPPPKVC